MGRIRLLDLFSGIGGFSLAAKRVYGDKLEIVGYSEIDKYAIKIYEKHFLGIKNYGDIRTIREGEIPDFDLCTFGFPCQDLSIAGKRKGFGGHRSSLFHEAIRIINAKRPKYFIFENVAGLFSSHEGKDFITVLQAITDIGYNGQWQLINTKWFLPQNRERIYFVGHLRGEPRPEVFPIGEGNEVDNESGIRQTKNIAGSIGTKNNSPQWRFDSSTTLISNSGLSRKWVEREDNIVPPLRANTGIGHNDLIQINNSKESGGTQPYQQNRIYHEDGIVPAHQAQMSSKSYLIQVATIGKDSEATRVYDTEGLARTIKNGGGMGAKTGLYAVKPVQIGHSELAWASQNGTNIGDENREAYTIRSSQPNGVSVMNNIRRLTPTECERLQGFPDGWTEGISDSQRYKCLGNAITVRVAEEIIKKLAKSFK
jgi:DNA (cytosine-5)-methyltransferase 1